VKNLFSTVNSLLRERAGGVYSGTGENMNEAGLREHLNRLGLPENGVTYVVNAALSGPALTVFHSNAKAFSGQLPSDIPTVLKDLPSSYRVQFSAFSTEFAFLSLESWKGDALLILDQPSAVPLTIINTRGKTQRITYTADYLLVREAIVEVVECKTVEELRKLCFKKSGQWVETESRFTNPAAETFFRSLGIAYRIVTDIDLPSLLVQNCNLLRNSSRNAEPADERLLVKITSYVAKSAPCSIDQVQRHFDLESAAPILECIHRRMVWADLRSVRLANSASRILCSTEAQANQIGQAIRAIDESAVSGEVLPHSELCHPKHFAEMALRLAFVNGEAPESSEPVPTDRTIRNWKAAYAENGIHGLMPKWHLSGTRGPRIIEWQFDVIDKAIEEGLSGTKSPTCVSIYEGSYKSELEKEASKRGEPARPVSRSHFAALWRSRQRDVRLARTRGGNRLANSVAPYTPVAMRREQASFPFSLAHVDHCVLPIKMRGPGKDTARIKRAILTLIIDAYSDEPLAWSVSFNPASSRATLLCLRQCARRYGRVPALLLTDGGADFKGNVFAESLAGLGVGWIKRPSASGRAGQPVERPFNTVSMSACRGFTGYVEKILNRRGIDRKFDPVNQPGRCMSDLRATLSDLLDHVIPESLGTHGEASPRKMRETFEATYGKQGVAVDPKSMKFAILTSVPLEIDSKTTDQGAIRFNKRRYFSGELTSHKHSTTSLEPRIDSEDDSIIYFAINGAWHSAHSSDRISRTGIDLQLLIDNWAITTDGEDTRNIAKAMASRQAKRKAIEEEEARKPKPALPSPTSQEPEEEPEIDLPNEEADEPFKSVSELLNGDIW
jgi:transposase InsO family protein